MSKSGRPVSVRGLGLVRAAWGLALITAPGLMVRIAGGGGGSPRRVVVVVRILGGRHLVQAAVTATRPAATVLLLGAAADGLHATSGVALGVLDARCRRPAFLDATVAAAFATAGLTAARRAALAGPTSR